MRHKIILIFFLIILSQSIYAQRVELSKQLYYYQPAASVFGAEAVWVNPAALSIYKASDIQIFADYYKGKFAKSWGTVFTRDGLGVAYRKIKDANGDTFKDYIFSGGMKFGNNLNLGISYQNYKEAPDYFQNKHFWTIGLLGQSGPMYKWAVVFSNLNRAEIYNSKTETEMRYSLAYRPIGSKLTFAADAFLSTKTKLRNAKFIYNVDANIIPGLYLNGLIDNDKNFEIGFRINFFNSFIGVRRSSNSKGHHRGSTFIYGNTSEKQESIIKEPKRRLLTYLSGSPQENPPQPIFGNKQSSYLQLLTDIYRAADDDSIDEMVLSLKKLSIGFAQAEELRTALKTFKSKKKRIICHISYPNNLSYYIGSIADKIIVPPQSKLNLIGLKAELTFFAESFKKLGVNAEILKIGDYKTAAETFTQDASSDANKEQMNRLLDNLYDQFVDGIAEGRSTTKKHVRSLIDQGPYTTQDALEVGLIDGIAYMDDLKELYIDTINSPSNEITMHAYHADTILSHSWKVKPVIAVIVAQGEVQSDGSGSFFTSKSDVTPSRMKRAINQAVQNENTKAILLRINSPGGVALAGEEIYHAFQKRKQKLPLVVSMGNVAASGGYYFAMAGETIFSNRATITGSIGIFGGKVDLSNFYEKISLKKEMYTRGKYAGMLSTIKPFTDDEREKYFSQLKSMYDHFVELVAENRLLPVDSINHLSQGKVWTGDEASKNGLVDKIGGYKDALDYIAKQNNLSNYQVEIFPRKRPFILLPGGSLFSSVSKLFKSNSTIELVKDQLKMFTPDEFYTRMPFDITIE